MEDFAMPAVVEPAMPTFDNTHAARKALLQEALAYFARHGVEPDADDPKIEQLLTALDSVDPLRATVRQEFGYLSYTCVINCGADRAAAERGFEINQTYFCQETSPAESHQPLRTRYISQWQPVNN